MSGRAGQTGPLGVCLFVLKSTLEVAVIARIRLMAPELHTCIAGTPMTSEQETTNPLPADTLPVRPIRPPFFERREGRILLFSSMGLFAVFLLFFGYFYFKFKRFICQSICGFL